MKTLYYFALAVLAIGCFENDRESKSMLSTGHFTVNRSDDGIYEYYDVKHHVYCWCSRWFEGLSCLPEAALRLPDGGSP